MHLPCILRCRRNTTNRNINGNINLHFWLSRRTSYPRKLILFIWRQCFQKLCWGPVISSNVLLERQKLTFAIHFCTVKVQNYCLFVGESQLEGFCTSSCSLIIICMTERSCNKMLKINDLVALEMGCINQ